jgi:hypothetical protein
LVGINAGLAAIGRVCDPSGDARQRGPLRTKDCINRTRIVTRRGRHPPLSVCHVGLQAVSRLGGMLAETLARIEKVTSGSVGSQGTEAGDNEPSQSESRADEQSSNRASCRQSGGADRQSRLGHFAGARNPYRPVSGAKRG